MWWYGGYWISSWDFCFVLLFYWKRKCDSVRRKWFWKLGLSALSCHSLKKMIYTSPALWLKTGSFPLRVICNTSLLIVYFVFNITSLQIRSMSFHRCLCGKTHTCLNANVSRHLHWILHSVKCLTCSSSPHQVCETAGLWDRTLLVALYVIIAKSWKECSLLL